MALIRPYAPSDRGPVRKIFQDTAFLGQSYTHFFDDGEWLADIMTAGYTDLQPEASFVAEHDGRVIGYLTGTTDTAGHWKRWNRKIFPRVAADFVGRGVWRNRRAWEFFYNGFKSALKGQEIAPKNLARDYPAHFHINMAEGHRGGGIGRQLAAAFFAHAKTRGAAGVHVRTTVPNGRNAFFESLGFKPLSKKELTVWSYLKQPIHTLITYGLTLTKMNHEEKS